MGLRRSLLNIDVNVSGSSCSEYYTKFCAGKNGAVTRIKSCRRVHLIVNKILRHNLSLHIMQTLIEFEIQQRQREEKT